MIEFKAEKRKGFEQKAAKLMKSCMNKHHFRNRLSRALKARDLVTRSTYNASFLMKLRKYLMANILATRVVSNAFNSARERIDGRSAWTVQRSLRGYLVRSQGDRLNWVKEAISAKENLRLHVSAKKIQKRLKGLIVRRRIDFLHKTASRIQSHFRMRWFKQVYQLIKKNTLILQRGVRRYMARRDMIKERMKHYLTQEYQLMYNCREMENV